PVRDSPPPGFPRPVLDARRPAGPGAGLPAVPAGGGSEDGGVRPGLLAGAPGPPGRHPRAPRGPAPRALRRANPPGHGPPGAGGAGPAAAPNQHARRPDPPGPDGVPGRPTFVRSLPGPGPLPARTGRP